MWTDKRSRAVHMSSVHMWPPLKMVAKVTQSNLEWYTLYKVHQYHLDKTVATFIFSIRNSFQEIEVNPIKIKTARYECWQQQKHRLHHYYHFIKNITHNSQDVSKIYALSSSATSENKILKIKYKVKLK